MTDKILNEIGFLIKQSRMGKHISQEELAWRCQITKNGLGKIELGRSQVRITTLIKLFKELGIDFCQLQTLLDTNSS